MVKLQPARANMSSAAEQPEVVKKYLLEGLSDN
jgi:hypothetical protein